MTNCPNCGAPISTDKCEYCGTVFTDYTKVDIGKTEQFIKIGDKCFKAYIANYKIINDRLYSDLERNMDGTLVRNRLGYLPQITLTLIPDKPLTEPITTIINHGGN